MVDSTLDLIFIADLTQARTTLDNKFLGLGHTQIVCGFLVLSSVISS